MVRKVRQRRVAGEEGGGGGGGGGGGEEKKRKRVDLRELNGWQWEASEKFDIERILDSKVETVGKVLAPSHSHLPLLIATPSLTCPTTSLLASQGKKRVEMTYYLILWKGYPPDVSTWEPESQIHDDLIDAYEAELDAASELEAEEAEEDEEGEEE